LHLAGFVCVWARVPQEELDQDPREQAYVSDLVVVARQRDRGIGRALLSRAEAHARAEGAPALGIDVLARNTGALELYRELGFSDYLVQIKKELEQLRRWSRPAWQPAARRRGHLTPATTPPRPPGDRKYKRPLEEPESWRNDNFRRSRPTWHALGESESPNGERAARGDRVGPGGAPSGRLPTTCRLEIERSYRG
jgi:hypothetical protein